MRRAKLNPSAGSVLSRRFRALARGEPDVAGRLVARRGSLADYAALARFHYRAGRPRAPVAVRVLAEPGDPGTPVAVMVVARPVLNGPWRELAWPGRYRLRDGSPAARRAMARRLNREVRTIARVIVDPRYRGLGLAVRLVRAYLRRPLTVRTEALAAMGAHSPFFQHAGMTAFRTTTSRRTAALHRALGGPAWRLACPARAGLSPAQRRVLRRWARGSRATLPRARGALSGLLPLAAASAFPLVAFCSRADREPRCPVVHSSRRTP